MKPRNSSRIQAIETLIQTVHQLRAPGGCPWDIEQTHQSLRPYLMEETFEVLEVLDQFQEGAESFRPHLNAALKEELGDLFLQILLHSEIAEERGAFDIGSLAQTLNDKLIRRHPHVFTSEVKLTTSAEVKSNWEVIKAQEKKKQPDPSALSGIPQALPALQRAFRIIEKASSFGFQWDDLKGPFLKVEEELAELKKEMDAETKSSTRMESELGDLLFSLCNLAYLLKLSPEDSLRSTLKRFEARFRHLENRLGHTPEKNSRSDRSLQEMNRFWEEAKVLEKTQVWGLTGGIASGKSAAGMIFSRLGIPVIDADQITRELSQEGGAASDLLLQRFKTLDPAKLREIVFSDLNAKQDLEAILHPLIQKVSQERILSLASHHPVIIYEATLLIETGRYKSLSGLIVIEASNELRMSRLRLRPHLTPEMAQKIISLQMSNDERRKYADVVIENTDSLIDLEAEITRLAREKKWIEF